MRKSDHDIKVEGMKTKFIFVTGGVLSSLGKGLAASSLGALLKTRGLAPTIICESAGTQAEDAAALKKLYEQG